MSEKPEFILFEHPTNERIRSLLRLEHLFTGIAHASSDPSRWGSRQALVGILEVGDVLSRSDMKAELIKELERHANVIGGLRDNPGVDPVRLKQIIEQIERQTGFLKSPECQPAMRIRTDELLNQIKQRVSIPGGACSFDLPTFHHWLNKPFHKRSTDLNHWMQDIRIIESAIDTILGDIRDSASPKTVTAPSGFLQQSQDTSVPCQLLRLHIEKDADIFPEISAGKHRFTIRLLRQKSTGDRPEQIDQPLSFKLQICGI